nr:helix-turn-helix transcriptional regulator [uncultured Ruminococcus sp.]
MPLQYRIDILQALKDKGYNTNRLRKEKLLSEGAIQRLRHSEPVSWSNIEQLCKLLECQPADIMEYVEDNAP